MADVVVERCTLRIVRRGGWSWGARPELLLERALEALPELLAARLGELGDALGGEGEVREPVRVAIPLQLEELRTGDLTEVEHLLAAALGAAVGPLLDPPGASSGSSWAADDGARPGAPEPIRAGAVSPAVLVARWFSAGTLERLLAGFSEHALEAWDRAVVGVAPAGAAAADEPRPEEAALRALVRQIARRTEAGATARSIRSSRIQAAAAALAAGAGAAQAAGLVRTELPLSEPALRRERLRIAKPRAQAPGARGTTGRVHPEAERPQVSEPAAPVRFSRGKGKSSVVVSALPFLLAGPLSRLGYFSALGTALDVAGLPGPAHAFAAALAYKVAEPPERGWRRSEFARQTAAAFAGRIEPVPDADLAALVRHGDELASPLDAALAVGLTRDRDPAFPLVLDRAPGDAFALVLPESGVLLALAPDSEHVVRLLAAAARPPVHVTVDAADREVLAALDSAGVAFSTPARPGRGERWRKIGRNRWGNAPVRRVDAAGSADLLATLAARPAFPLASDAALEQTVTLAAAAALATIARRLWGAAEGAQPLLSLERLSDLDARVRLEPDRVRVNLPLGRRQQSLEREGLLASVRDAPWLDGRLIEFAGG